jgi:ABC-type nitrate/sulfonate/bicarbonate transport system substrate-binding protein
MRSTTRPYTCIRADAVSAISQAQPLRVSVFAGAAALPIQIARDRGYFGSCGLDVEVVETRSSDALMTGLVEGAFDVVHASPDNVVAWRDRLGADIVAWIGLASGPVALVAAAGTPAVAAIRGQRIAVDAPQSGFVSVLRRMLRAGGVNPADVELVPVGSTDLRFEALASGNVAATLLTLPWLLSAMDDGLAVLVEQRAVAPRLQGSCGASLGAWLSDRADVADGYLRAIVAALTWLYLPASLPLLRSLLRERFHVDDRHAAAICDAFLDPASGWPPSARIDPVGMEAVCELRAETGAPAHAAPATYYTLEPYARVLGSGLLTGAR